MFLKINNQKNYMVRKNRKNLFNKLNKNRVGTEINGRKPSSEKIAKVNLNDKLFEAIKEKDLEKTRKLLERGARIDENDNEIIKKYADLFYRNDYSNELMEKFYNVFNETLNDEWAWMGLNNLAGKKSMEHWKLGVSIRESVNKNELSRFKECLKVIKEENFNLINEIFEISEEISSYDFNLLKTLREKNETSNLLMLVVQKGNMEMFNELIKMDVDVNFENNMGKTALSIAKKHRRGKMIKVLKEKSK